MGKTSYLIALGSNRRHARYGGPRQVVAEATATLRRTGGIKLKLTAPIFTTTAFGPAGRAYANSAVLIRSASDPAQLLAILKSIERDFGRRRGRRWGPRVLDLDIILWSDGLWIDRRLAIPHPGYRQRRFVLDPLVKIAPAWRDPLDGSTVRQLRARLLQRKPVDRRGSAA